MKQVYTVTVRHGLCSSTEYQVVAKTCEEALKKARDRARRDGRINPSVRSLVHLGAVV